MINSAEKTMENILASGKGENSSVNHLLFAPLEREK
jgi:hypothetical protein